MTRPSGGAARRGATARVLAVDDSPTYLHALAEWLEGEGYEVSLARSGEETCRRIKASDRSRDIPLIILTAHADREGMIQQMSAGADDYVAKSSDLAVLGVRPAAQALETIERNAGAQARLVDDLLDVSRAITGKLKIAILPTALAPPIEAAVEVLRPAASAKGIALDVAIDPSAGPIAGDESRLRQIVWNLVSNAVKFTPRGGRIEVRLTRSDYRVRITVADTGVGIAAEFLPHAFERFRQADASSTRAHGGLGLGLSIVRHLAGLHGGTVRAESAGEGRGATFIVELPIMGAAAAAPGAGADQGGGPVAEEAGRDEVRDRAVLALEGERVELDRKEHGDVIGKAAEVIGDPGEAGRPAGAGETGDRHALEVLPQAEAVREPGIDRGDRDPAGRDEEERIDVARLETRRRERAAHCLLAEVRRHPDEGLVRGRERP